jgi:glycosyltransferase involved in cell wall biosynthesis
MSKVGILMLADSRVDRWAWLTMEELARGLSESFEFHVGSLGVVVPPGVKPLVREHRLGFPPRAPLAAVPWLRGVLRRTGCRVIHAWGAMPAALARMAAPAAHPLVASVYEPLVGRQEEKWLLSARSDRPLPAICPTGFIRRTLVEKGHPLNDATVIRPSVDFGLINRAKQARLRETLKLTPEQPLLVTCPPPSRAGGQYFAIWAGALCRQIFPDLRMIVPGESREQARLRRFTHSFQQPELALFIGERYTWPEILAAADLCLAPALAPISTVGLGWAMAAAVPIAGSAIPVVTELLANDVNALLSVAGRPEKLAARTLRLLQDRANARRLADTARSQAFEVFSRQRMIDQHRKVYTALLEDGPPFENVIDAALAP